MLTTEFNYYLTHQDELVKQYNGQYVVIVNKQVVGVFQTEQEAYINSIQLYPAGTFLIQQCTAGTTAYTQTFLSNVSFTPVS